MKRKASASHDESTIRWLRKDLDFAAECLKATLEDEDEPRVLLIALRYLAQAAGIDRESLYRTCLSTVILASPRWLPSLRHSG